MNILCLSLFSHIIMSSCFRVIVVLQLSLVDPDRTGVTVNPMNVEACDMSNHLIQLSVVYLSWDNAVAF